MTETLLPVVLCADALWSRYGFGDGDPFEFADRGPAFDNAPRPPLEDAIASLDMQARGDLLEMLVIRHLLPEIERVSGSTPRLARIGTHHNQVRDAAFDRDPSAMPRSWDGVEVVVTPGQIATALAELHGQASADAATTA